MTEIKEVLTEGTETKARKTAAKQSTAKTESGTVVYIGPNIPGVAKQGTVYNNGLPGALMEKAKEIPAINALIVPVEGLARANAELARGGSALSIIYNKVNQ